MKLSITHNFRPDDRAQLDVGQARQSAPHDRIARRGVIGSGEIAAQPCDFDQVVGQRFSSERLPVFILHEVIEQVDFRYS